MLAFDKVVTINVLVSLGGRRSVRGRSVESGLARGAAGWSCALGNLGEEGKGLGGTLQGG